MAVDAVITGVELSANEPLPERRVAGIQRGVPVLVPAKHVGIFSETVREFFDTESLAHRRIGQVRLTNEFGGGIEIFFLFPMDRNLRLANIDIGLCHCCWFCFLWHGTLLYGLV